MRRTFLALTTMLAAVVTLNAEPVPLAETALRELAVGKTVHLESPYGTLPVSFKADGTLSAKASGLLATYLGSATDRGRWNVQGDRICQKFFKWFHGETHCMRVKADGRRITWRRDDGLSGTATIAANDAAPPERPVGLGAPVEQVAPAEPVTPEPKAASPPPRFAAASVASVTDVRAVTQQGAAPAAPAADAIVKRAPSVGAQRTLPVKLAALPPNAEVPASDAEPDGGVTRKPPVSAMTAARPVVTPPKTQISEMFGARIRHGWCQTLPHGAALSVPALLVVARGGTPGAASDRDLAGCLAITPPLAEIARAGLASQ